MTADEVKAVLGLEEHTREGGWFVQTYASGVILPAVEFARSAEPMEYSGPRRISTAIYYLLETGTFGELHRLKSDEVFHHYAGSPVEMLLLHPGGRTETFLLGKELDGGQRPQIVVPQGVWQGSRLLEAVGDENEWALLGCTVSPGFEYADYESATREEMFAGWPSEWERIMALTRHGVR